MEERTLGHDGPQVTVLGLGCNNFGMKLDRDESIAVVRAALDAGVTHFDTAEMYGGGASEELLGIGLGRHRDGVVIATKFLPRPTGEPYVPGALARRVRDGCETSLRRLGTDRIDVYYQHYPDPDAPADEAGEALEALVADGKVRHLGTSNVSAAQLGDIRARVVAVQSEWNLLAREIEAELVPTANRLGVAIVPYFPLASGLLTGKYRSGEDFPEGSRLASMPVFGGVATSDNLERVERLREVAEARGHTLLELAVSWLLAQPGVATVICGATSRGQVEANAMAAHWRLTADDLDAVETALASTRSS